jgi:hypothetical protein
METLVIIQFKNDHPGEISGYHGDEYEDGCLPSSEAVSSSVTSVSV